MNRKDLKPYFNLSRLAPVSHFMSKAIHEPLAAYKPSNILAWVSHVGAYWLHKKYPFPRIAPTAVKIDNSVLISIIGDWGSGTDEAASVAVQVAKENPDYTIHLGDVYYIGNEQEVDENFLGIQSSTYDPVMWPRGLKGSFSLCGNHDMYSNGGAYFTKLLSALNQPTSFFRLENDNWIILGLDTGYNSTGLELWPFRPSCRFPDMLIDWLYENPIDEKKSVIVMTHHQPWSSFEKGYSGPAKQLSEFIKQPFIWIWGHEHRMAVYDLHSDFGITARGFCAGHGGMPVTLKKPHSPDNPRLLYTDLREYPNGEGLKVGYNGYLNLSIHEKFFILEFIDLDGNLVYSFRR